MYTDITKVINYHFILYTSISESYQTSTTSICYGTNRVGGGQIRVISTNTSKNYCFRHSTFRLVAIDNSASSKLNYTFEDSYIHYCNLMNNYSPQFGCLGFFCYTQRCEENNVVNNSQGTIQNGIISNDKDAETMVNKCCFFNNNVTFICLFYVATGTLCVDESYVQSGSIISSSSGLYNQSTIYHYFKYDFDECIRIYKSANYKDIKLLKKQVILINNIIIPELVNL
jgi:hypothetical protein